MERGRAARLGLGILGGVLVSLSLAAGAARSASGPEASVHAAGSGSADTGTTAEGLASLELAFPGPERRDLELPPALWEAVGRRVGAREGAPAALTEAGAGIGYSAVTMGQYGRSTHLLPGVLRLFADARTVSRETGRWSDQLLGDAQKCAAFGYGWDQGGIGEMARRCYGLLGISTGRRTMPAIDSTWTGESPPFAVPLNRQAAWTALPAAARNLIVRLYQGAQAAGPWVRRAFGPRDLIASLPVDSLHTLAMAHRNDEAFGQLASLRGDYRDLFANLDLAYLGYATIVWSRYLESALADYAAATAAGSTVSPAAGSNPAAGGPDGTFRIPTELGDILVGGPGDDTHQQPAFLVVDVGGNDTYGPGFAASASLASPVACLIDLAGDDRYRADAPAAEARQADGADGASGDEAVDTGRPLPGAGRVPPSFGAGIFGIGIMIDLAGNDVYRAHESGLGRGCFGSGLLFDFAGDDTYHGGARWTQGAAHGGIGVLCDLAGEDEYSCAQQSQGLGATLGTGLLLDLAGDDRYVARDDGNVSALYLGQSVAMSQGCGYGRRADLGDGHSLAGGVGLLIDGNGDDDYHAQVWSQGCGYWWGVGVLEDRAGHDTYRNGKYSSGAAAHFAIGVHVDLTGDDRYNQGNDTAKNQYQGHARDGSLGIFIDGDGDDRYELRSHCAGSGDLGSVGLFWERRGRDHYHHDPADLGDSGWARTPPLGSTTEYAPFRSFRDEVPVYGIFLDTGGRDQYQTGGVGRNDDRWESRRYPGAWGLGIDQEVYPRERD